MSKAGLLIGLALSAAGAAIQYSGQRAAQKRQEDENARWLDYQNRAKKKARAIEDEKRGEATEKFNELAENMGLESREAVIDEETDTRNEQISEQAGMPFFGDETRFSGQQQGRSGEFDSSLALNLNKASGEVRDRIAALARASAYTGGQNQFINEAFQEGTRGIGRANSARSDNARVLAANQAVVPKQIQYDPGLLPGLLQGAGSMVAGMDPSALGFGAAGVPTPGTQIPIPTAAPRYTPIPTAAPRTFSFLPQNNLAHGMQY